MSVCGARQRRDVIRFQCLTSLKWLSRVRVQEEDYGFLPVTRWNPEGCHGGD